MRSLFHSLLAVMLPQMPLALSANAADGLNTIPPAQWVAAWRTSMMPPDAGSALFLGVQSRTFNNETVRQTAVVTADGNALRIRLSNLYGDAPLTLTDVHVAKAAAESGTQPGSRSITFGGKSHVEIAAGMEAISDPVDFAVVKGERLSISLFVPRLTTPATWHWIAAQTSHVAPGNQAGAARLADASDLSSFYWLSGIDVRSTEPRKVIVMFGDSLTDGAYSTPDAMQRYPDQLFARLQTLPSTQRFGVVNAGIAGNRLLHDIAGPSAMSRFEREVIAAPAASDVLILIGVNDLGIPEWLNRPAETVSAAQIIAGLKTLAAKAKAHRIRAYIGTLLPFEGTASPGFFSETTERKRQEINAWIRGNTDFDATIDFDAVMHDPLRPSRLRTEYDSGDHLHLNDAGYKAMADAVDLTLFR